MRPLWATAIAAFVALVSCAKRTPAPLGEALVVVQTDVAVPRRVSRMRVEVFGENDLLVERREVVTPSVEDWPVSFSVVLPDGRAEGDVFVRLRAYPEGHEMSAREIERIDREPPRNIAVYGSMEDACREAPRLELARPLTLRRGAVPITSLLPIQDCRDETRSGSAVARLEIEEQGDYRIEVVRAVPNAANREPGSDTDISLRKECLQGTTQLACSDRISDVNHLSRIDRVTLAPGTYWVVTGGADPAPADLTLLASRLDVIQPTPPDDTPPFTSDPAAVDPSPGVTIDRIVGLHITAGKRGRVDVMLHGECFGAPSDLAKRTTCVEKEGESAPVLLEVPFGELARDLPVPSPWSADTPAPCTVAPRDAREICVPGGAFVLGDTLALEDLERRSQPEHMRIVEPFLIDEYEMSVARYRAALAAGFAPVDATPIANPQPTLTQNVNAGMCTFTTDPGPRESYPLNCTSFSTARALCKFLGADLPTEEQLEYAATAAGREVETNYPWGSDLPSCDQTVFGRTLLATSACPQKPLGPVPVDDPILVNGDVVPGLGIVGLAGNVEELSATAFVPYSDPTWRKAFLRGVVDEAEAPLVSARGADWLVGPLYATGSTRRAEPYIAAYNNVGFRCARKGR